MPCYEVNEISVEFQAADLNSLEKSAFSIGYKTVSIGKDNVLWIRGGNKTPLRLYKGIISGEQKNINDLKQNYSKQIVFKSARQNGWQVSEKSQHLQVIKY